MQSRALLRELAELSRTDTFFSSDFSLAVKLINKGPACSFLGCLEKEITGKNISSAKAGAAEHSVQPC